MDFIAKRFYYTTESFAFNLANTTIVNNNSTTSYLIIGHDCETKFTEVISPPDSCLKQCLVFVQNVNNGLISESKHLVHYRYLNKFHFWLATANSTDSRRLFTLNYDEALSGFVLENRLYMFRARLTKSDDVFVCNDTFVETKFAIECLKKPVLKFFHIFPTAITGVNQSSSIESMIREAPDDSCKNLRFIKACF